MNPLLKGAMAFGTLAGAGGTAYGIYNSMQPTPEKVKTYLEELEGTLLSTEDSYKDKWVARLTSLQSVDSEDKLVQGLKGLKTKSGDDQWKTLRNWCKDTIKQPTKEKEDQEFQNIQNYCTFSIKEKITNAVDISTTANDDTKWNVAYNKLQSINDGLDSELIVAKAKKDPKKYEEVKEWCTKAYKKPYKGEDDKDFKNASRICLSK